MKLNYVLMVISVLLCSSGRQVTAQFNSGTVLQQSLLQYINQMMNNQNPNPSPTPSASLGIVPTTTTAAPLPPVQYQPTNPFQPSNSFQLNPTTPPPTVGAPPSNSANEVTSLFQQIVNMANRPTGPVNPPMAPTTTASPPMPNSFFQMMNNFPPTTTTTPAPTTQGSVPFDPWAQSPNSHMSNTVQPSPVHHGQGGHRGPSNNFRLNRWEQYRPHPDPWSSPSTAPTTPKPAPTQAQLMRTFMPLQLQQNMMNAGRTGFVKPTIYFEEHGCVDPKMHLPRGSPSPGLVLGCASPQSKRVCDEVGKAMSAAAEIPAATQEMNAFVLKTNPGYKKLLEKCLSPNIMKKIEMQQKMNRQMMMMRIMSHMFQRRAPAQNSMTSQGGMGGGLNPMTSQGGMGGGLNPMTSQGGMGGGLNPMTSQGGMGGGLNPQGGLMPQSGFPSGQSGQNPTGPLSGSAPTTTSSPLDSLFSSGGSGSGLDQVFGSVPSGSGSSGSSGTSGSSPTGQPASTATPAPASGPMFALPTSGPSGSSGPFSPSGPSGMQSFASMFMGKRKKRQASGNFMMSNLYDRLFRPHATGYMTSGAATIPRGANQINSISATSNPPSNFQSGSSGGQSGSGLLSSNTGGSLPTGAAMPSNANAGAGTSPSMGGMMNMMSNMMSGSMGGSLPTGAAAPPSGGMSSPFGSMMGGHGAHAGAGAAGAAPEPTLQQCERALPMLLASAGVEGAMGSPEANEMMGEVRRSMLPMECQEFPMMNFRMCCPGKVANPTFQDMMTAGANAGAK